MTLQQRLALYISLGVIVGFLVVELPHAKRYSYHGLVLEMDVPAMAKEAELMFSGTVMKELGTVRTTDPAGEDIVYTRWLIRPDRFTKGSASKPIVVRTIGGQYNLTFVEVDDYPSFTVGESVALFLKTHPDWKGDYRVVGEFQGKFRLDESNGTLTAIQAESESKKPLTDLEQQVRAALETK